jgi:hypothetical protein
VKKVEFWRWEVWSETGPRKRVKTRHHMTEADAMERDPTATRVAGTMEIRELPETDEERAALVSRAKPQR